jgi:hypothetical protein
MIRTCRLLVGAGVVLPALFACCVYAGQQKRVGGFSFAQSEPGQSKQIGSPAYVAPTNAPQTVQQRQQQAQQQTQVEQQEKCQALAGQWVRSASSGDPEKGCWGGCQASEEFTRKGYDQFGRYYAFYEAKYTGQVCR